MPAGGMTPFLPLKNRRMAGGRWRTYCILFVTGFTSMSLEVIWVRDFTPVLGDHHLCICDDRGGVSFGHLDGVYGLS